MAINKNKNVMIQITISKADNERLSAIQDELSANLSIELSKSQTIAFLIKNYGARPTAPTPRNDEPRAKKGAINYQAQIIALKDKLNVSFTRLSEILGIPASTLKKYASGTQQPKNENEQIIKQALARYGIK